MSSGGGTPINFSTRQNKSIERSIVFDGLAAIMGSGAYRDAVYVGFGSVWFADFHLAHRRLGIDRMVSIEAGATKASRARFNKPFRTIEIIEGRSTAVLPTLVTRPDLATTPWIAWLDYDDCFLEDQISDASLMVARAPAGSVYLATVNCHAASYDEVKPRRLTTLKEIFGDELCADLTLDAVSTQAGFSESLARIIQNLLAARAVQSGRRYVPAFGIRYTDGADMLTVGGVIYDLDGPDCTDVISDPSWPAIQKLPIRTNALTIKEVIALRSLLPADDSISASQVRGLGFDLSEADLDAFSRHYTRYPVYSDIASTL